MTHPEGTQGQAQHVDLTQNQAQRSGTNLQGELAPGGQGTPLQVPRCPVWQMQAGWELLSSAQGRELPRWQHLGPEEL